ncbi:MAG: RNA polymerase sigma-54 factor, partial [Chitinophagales bacterium]
MALSQRLQQKLLQKLSPQQIQLMKLLQVPTASLEVRIKEEMEENPALELDEDKYEENPEELKDEFAENGAEDFEENTDVVDGFENIDISEYVQDGDDDIADYKLRTNNYPDEEERRESPVKMETSFYDTLRSQLGLLKLDEKEMRIAEQINGSIYEE